jgi:fused signal recognition particle receptor
MLLTHLFRFPFPGLPVVALLSQIPLAALAALVEWNQRKKRPNTGRDGLASRRLQSKRPVTKRAEPGLPPEPSVEAPERKIGAAAWAHAEPSLPSEAAPAAQPGAPPRVEPSPPTHEAEVGPLPADVRDGASRDVAGPTAEEQPIRVGQLEQKVEVVPELLPELVREAPVEPLRKRPIPIGLGLRKTRENFLARIRAAITGAARVDEIYEGLEEALIGADVGVETSMKLVEAVRSKLKNDARADVIRDTLKQEMVQTLLSIEKPMNDASPLIIMMAGVNGVGKTTTVAKLAALLKAERGSVIVAASDTFRAAAIDQLQIWCDRVGAELVKQKQGSDPAAVAFDAVKAANARKVGAVLIDTAGRLQTKVNLMEELKKIARIVGREIPGAPHENWLVLDATTGQNALSQAKVFSEAIKLTGVVLAKLDSTAKGGVIVAIAERLKLPVRYIGLGEQIEDLSPFHPREFVEALFSETDDTRAAADGTYAA